MLSYEFSLSFNSLSGWALGINSGLLFMHLFFRGEAHHTALHNPALENPASPYHLPRPQHRRLRQDIQFGPPSRNDGSYQQFMCILPKALPTLSHLIFKINLQSGYHYNLYFKDFVQSGQTMCSRSHN